MRTRFLCLVPIILLLCVGIFSQAGTRFVVAASIDPASIQLGAGPVTCTCLVTNTSNRPKTVDEIEIATYPIPQDCNGGWIYDYLADFDNVTFGPGETLTFSAPYNPVCATRHVAYCYVSQHSSSAKNTVIGSIEYQVTQ